MSKKYDEVMDRVRLSDAARSRILEKVRQADTKPRSFQWRQWGALAACLTLAIIGVFVWQSRNPSVPRNEPTVMLPNNIAECASLDELETAIGFPIEDVAQAVPEASEVKYYNYFGELAQIDLIRGGQQISFRKSPGTEDNTGDYNVYDTVQEVTLDGISCQFKGNDDTITLVLWQKGDYTYSLRLEPPMSESDAAALCQQILALQ